MDEPLRQRSCRQCGRLFAICDLSDFCGAVPRVGDFIVSRWLRDSKVEAGLWSNRTIQVVEAVYYRPDKRNKDEDDSWVVLVVKERPMTEAEEDLL